MNMDDVSQNSSVLLLDLIKNLIFENGRDHLPDFAEHAETLCREADEQGLGAFIYFFLHDEKFIPADYEKKFAAAFRTMSAAELKRSAALNNILKIFSENNILAAPLKGAALAYSSYPHPALRSMGDFDILVKPDEISPVRRLLQERGFTADRLHPATFFAPVGYALDLHQHISHTASYPAEYLWDESRKVPFLNFGAVLLSPELNILHAIEHALHDNLVCGFKVFIDIAFIISREGPSPKKLEQLARKLDMYQDLVFFMNIFPVFFPEEYSYEAECDSEEILEKARFLILNAKRLQTLDKHALMLAGDYKHLRGMGKFIYLFNKLLKDRKKLEYSYKRPINFLNYPVYYCREIFTQLGELINFYRSYGNAAFLRNAGYARHRIKSYLQM
jgi:hypothetical protein